MKRSEAPKFNDQYRSNRLKAIGCERALGSKSFGQLHQRADGTAHKCARTERAGRKQMQGSEYRGWLYRARMSSRGAVGVPRSKRGDAGRVKGSEYREWLQRARMRSRSADGALGRQPEGAGKICGQVETGCRPNLKPALSGWHGAWWPCGRRAQPHLGVDRSTDAPERKGRSEVQDDKTPRRSNDADGPGRGVNDHQLRVGKRLGVPIIATGVRGCSRGHRGTAGRPRMRCGSPDRASEHLRFRNQVTTSSGGAGPGDDIIDLSRSNSHAIKRARDVTQNIVAGKPNADQIYTALSSVSYAPDGRYTLIRASKPIMFLMMASNENIAVPYSNVLVDTAMISLEAIVQQYREYTHLPKSNGLPAVAIQEAKFQLSGRAQHLRRRHNPIHFTPWHWQRNNAAKNGWQHYGKFVRQRNTRRREKDIQNIGHGTTGETQFSNAIDNAHANSENWGNQWGLKDATMSTRHCTLLSVIVGKIIDYFVDEFLVHFGFPVPVGHMRNGNKDCQRSREELSEVFSDELCVTALPAPDRATISLLIGP
ncbi:hypothetical protein GGX14DRAFT_673868 [Mycena pura]|uniref:Uncharacterized protein n=1 Tax=Mycena pura TaxID=153505 RepID=A0AAD6UZN6_9AGAR|nr:hypothetical protein GGX14DRAFT_673868 [Mycena pura]